MGGFEQFDEVAVGVGEEDLAPAGATTSLWKDNPASRSRVISASRSSKVRWMRLRPAVVAVSSGVARAPELAGPDSRSRRGPRTTSAKAGAALVFTVKPTWVV